MKGAVAALATTPAETPTILVERVSSSTFRIRIGDARAIAQTSYLGLATPPSAIDATTVDGPGIRTSQDGRWLGLIGPGGLERARLEIATVIRDGRIRLNFELSAEQHLYGLGQGGHGFDRLGVSRTLWNAHVNHGLGGDIAVPVLFSNLGSGLFFDCSARARVDAGDSNESVNLCAEFEADAIDVYYFAGPTLRDAVGAHAALTGFAPMPPRWSLGFVQSTRHFSDANDLRALLESFRASETPCDALVLLSTYGQACGWNRNVGDLRFSQGLAGGNGELLGEIARAGMRVIAHEYPVLHPESPLFAEASARGFLLDAGFPDRRAAPPGPSNYHEGQRYLDFANPEVGRWWWDRHAHLLAAGVDGWWLDGGEGPPEGTATSRGDNAQTHNRFDLCRQLAFRDGEARDRPRRRPYFLCRSGGPGMQGLGSAAWSGDVDATFASLEAQVPLGLNVAMSGVPYWGTDTGGYYPVAGRNAELFVRWFQFSVFCGVFRAHGKEWRNHLPFGHGEATDRILRRFVELRYELMPYTYSLAWQAHRDGLPLQRPMVLSYPADPNVAALGSQFLWGDDLLVAPVTRASAVAWHVYLPYGTWFDFWTGETHAGGRSVSVEAPLDRMPIFVRSGAIIPMSTDRPRAGAPSPEHVMLAVYPEGRSAFTLYDDDGETDAYLDGRSARTRIECERFGERIDIRIGAPEGDPASVPATRTYTLCVKGIRVPTHVRIDGTGPAGGQTEWTRSADGTLRIGPVCAPAMLRIDF